MFPLRRVLSCQVPLKSCSVRFFQVGRPLLNDQTSFFGEMTKKAKLDSEDDSGL